MTLRIAGAQLPVTQDVQANRSAIGQAIQFAAASGASILLTPEGSLSGYTPSFDSAEVSTALADVVAQARAAHVGLALGTCFIEPDDGRCYNELRFYTPDGAFLGCHTKTLTCGSMTHPSEGEINDYAVRPLRTFSFEGVPVGGLICNDLWANPSCTPMPDPHLTHQLAERGARVIFHAVNGGRLDDPAAWELCWQYHDANLRLRAGASSMWIVTVDNCAPLDHKCSAPSGVIDPSGSWVCRTEPIGVQYFTYDID